MRLSCILAASSTALAATASLQVSQGFISGAIFENRPLSATVSVTPVGGGYDASRFFGSIAYTDTNGAAVGIGFASFYAPSHGRGTPMGSIAQLTGIPGAGTYELKFEGLVEHLGYFNYGSSQAVWGMPENFSTTISIEVLEEPLNDQGSALSNADNAKGGKLSVSNASYRGEWWNPRTIQTQIRQSFTTGAEQVFLDRITIRDREIDDAPVYYVRVEGPSINRLLGRVQKAGKYHTDYVPYPQDGAAILQPNTTYWFVMVPNIVPPFTASFDATSDRLKYETALGWTVGETLLVTHDSGGNENAGGYEPVYTPPSTTTTNSNLAPLFAIFATPTGGYDGFPLEGAATLHPFDPSTAPNWSSDGTEWEVDTASSHDGVDSVRARTSNGGATYREYSLTGPAVVDFWWKVSSEKNFDTFSYSLNGAVQETISGEVDWTYRTFILPAGTHTIRWTYAKDSSDAVGQDAGWLDDFAVYPAKATLQVRDGATVLEGVVTVDFGSADLGDTVFTKVLKFANNGYVPLELRLSLPEESPFTFEAGAATCDLLIGRGESVDVPVMLATTTAGSKSAQINISASDATVATPSITLSGYVRGPEISVEAAGTTLVPGISFDMGLAPKSVVFAINNDGLVGDLVVSEISVTGNFEVVQQPAASIPAGGSSSFKVLAKNVANGLQSGSVSIKSNAANAATFVIPVKSKALLANVTGGNISSVTSSGDGGAAGWDLASTTLPDGTVGNALKTGATPDNGKSHLEAAFEAAGILRWKWKLSAQEEFDWLVCEVSGGPNPSAYSDRIDDTVLHSSGGALDIVGMEVSETAADLIFTVTLNGNIAEMNPNHAEFYIAIADGKSPGDMAGNPWGSPIRLTTPDGGMTHWIGSWITQSGTGAQLSTHSGGRWSAAAAQVGFATTAARLSTLQYTVSKASLGFQRGDVLHFDVYSALAYYSATGAVDALSNAKPTITAFGQTYVSSPATGISRYPTGGEVAAISTKNAVWREQVVHVPANSTVQWTYRKDGNAAVGDDAGYISDLSFEPFTGPQTTYAGWWAQFGRPAPPDPKTPMAMSGLPAIMSWVGGLHPDNVPDAGLMRLLKDGGQWKFRFPISKKYGGGSVSAEFTPHLNSGWSGAGVNQTLHSQDTHTVIIEATPPAGATRGFMRLNVR